MLLFAQIDRQTKRVLQFIGGNSQDAVSAHMEASPDCWFVPASEYGDPKDFALNPDGFIVRVEAVEDLDGAKRAKWGRFKAHRDGLCNAPLNLGGRLFQADEVSRVRIAEWAARASRASEGWNIEWTLLDNTAVMLSAAELLALDDAIAVRNRSAVTVARALRASIDLAGSFEQLDAVNWPAEQA